MGALDTVKEIGRITITSGLSKEIIELLEKKTVLLAEQVATLETENANLKEKVKNLEQELERVRPKGDRLEEGAEKILQLLFENDEESLQYVGVMAGALGMKKGVVQYHCDGLYEAEFLGVGGPEMFHLYPKGRAYVVKYLLKD